MNDSHHHVRIEDADGQPVDLAGSKRVRRAFAETTYLDHWEIREQRGDDEVILATFPGADEKAARKVFDALKVRSGIDPLFLERKYAVVWQDGSK